MHGNRLIAESSCPNKAQADEEGAGLRMGTAGDYLQSSFVPDDEKECSAEWYSLLASEMTVDPCLY